MVKIPDDKDKITIDEDRVFVPSIEDTEDNTEEEWFEEYLDLLNEDTAQIEQNFHKIRFGFKIAVISVFKAFSSGLGALIDETYKLSVCLLLAADFILSGSYGVIRHTTETVAGRFLTTSRWFQFLFICSLVLVLLVVVVWAAYTIELFGLTRSQFRLLISVVSTVGILVTATGTVLRILFRAE